MHYRLQGTSPPPGLAADVEATIREQVQDFCTAFNTGNYDHCAALFLPEGQLMMPNRETVHGQHAVEHSLREMADAGYQNLRRETLRVEVSGDMGMEIGQYSLSIRSANGKVINDRGKYLACWRRLGVWRMTADCWSASVPLVQESQERQLRTVERPEIIPRDVQRPA